MQIALLITGDEILAGDLQDSNSFYLIQKFSELNLRITQVAVVGDNPQIITSKIKTLSKESDILIVNGGLGPTVDDYTSQCLATALNCDLIENQEALKQVTKILQQKGRKINQANMKQVIIPRKAKPIFNRAGTAPGIYAELNTCQIFCTPGVPKELFIMFEEQILPKITQTQTTKTLLIRNFGVGEASLQTLISKECLFDKNDKIKLGFRTDFPYLDIKITSFSKENQSQAQQKFKKLQQLLKHTAFATKPITLGETIVELLNKEKKTISFAESCTGGLLTSQITAVARSSKIFQASYITYNSVQKKECLNVSDKAFKFGEVSKEVVTAMLLGALAKSGSDLGAAISGIAGPDGGTKEKPVGTIWIAWGNKKNFAAKKFNFVTKGRKTIQILAANLVLDLLRRKIENIPYLENYSFAKTSNK